MGKLLRKLAFRRLSVRPLGPDGVRTLRPATDADLRSRFAHKGPIVAAIDAVRRERETESDK